ncbi:hypothetical protein [Hungatella hathewayi]|jgi:transposase|uniref:hypothetical protein n=1 Tax=Hungatella hathewayi TaxID=154046 RepID=UPI000ABB4F59|nr:hypothetical protein [Hungatella hathewayi]
MLADISGLHVVYIICGMINMCKSIDGLCASIQEQFSMNNRHALFVLLPQM